MNKANGPENTSKRGIDMCEESIEKKWKCLRCIVPFSLRGDGEKAFQEALVKMNQSKAWEHRPLNNGKSEHDVYYYIMSSFSEDVPKDEMSETTNSGFHWSLKNKNAGEIGAFLFRANKNDEPKKVRVEDIGVFLFRTGIGFLWFQYSYDAKDVDELIDFLYCFKEFTKDHCLGFETDIKNKTLYVKDIRDSVSANGGENSIEIKPGKTSGEKKEYLSKGVIYKNLGVETENIELKNIELERINDDLIKVSCVKFEKGKMGLWVYNTLKFLNVKYFAMRTSKKNGGIKIPDKGILYSYVIDQNEINDSEEKAYWVANGYKKSYLCGKMSKDEMRRPFENVIWYATKEGCVYYVDKTNEDNVKFFYGSMAYNFMGDYFTLFIKVLHQSYSLLNFATYIEKELSADSRSYSYRKTGKRRVVQENLIKLREIRTSINVFQMKSVATSVSHVHHQNRFYEYVLEQLRVKDDMESVSAGLAALNELVKENVEEEDKKREGMMSNAMNVIGLLAIFSALMDGVGFVAFWNGDSGYKSEMHSMVCMVLVVVGVISLIFLAILIRYEVKTFINWLSKLRARKR